MAACTIELISLALGGVGAEAAEAAIAVSTIACNSAADTCSGISGAGISDIAPRTNCCISDADTGSGAAGAAGTACNACCTADSTAD